MSQVHTISAGLLDIGLSFVWRFDFNRRTKDRVDAGLVAHWTSLPITAGRTATNQCDEMASGGPPRAADFMIFFAGRHRRFRQGARHERRPNSVSPWCARYASDRLPR